MFEVLNKIKIKTGSEEEFDIIKHDNYERKL